MPGIPGFSPFSFLKGSSRRANAWPPEHNVSQRRKPSARVPPGCSLGCSPTSKPQCRFQLREIMRHPATAISGVVVLEVFDQLLHLPPSRRRLHCLPRRLTSQRRQRRLRPGGVVLVVVFRYQLLLDFRRDSGAGVRRWAITSSEASSVA